MLRTACLLGLLAWAVTRAEIIDRIAATVGGQVITTSDIALEIRLTAFLNGEEPDFSERSRRETTERLVERTLIRREMELSRYPMPQPAEAGPMLAELKKERFAAEQRYREALEKYEITEEQLLQQLLKQLATLRFIELRFRPGIHILDPELREYYENRLLVEWENKSRNAAPAFEEVRQNIEEILINEKVDQLLDDWLKQTRARIRVQFREEAFR